MSSDSSDSRPLQHHAGRHASADAPGRTTEQVRPRTAPAPEPAPAAAGASPAAADHRPRSPRPLHRLPDPDPDPDHPDTVDDGTSGTGRTTPRAVPDTSATTSDLTVTFYKLTPPPHRPHPTTTTGYDEPPTRSSNKRPRNSTDGLSILGGHSATNRHTDSATPAIPEAATTPESHPTGIGAREPATALTTTTGPNRGSRAPRNTPRGGERSRHTDALQR